MGNFSARLFFRTASALAACPREKTECSMIDRRWFGDLGLAVLIAMPIASLALPLPISSQPNATPVVAKTAAVDRIAASGRISLLG
jgi:hypothetical protein